MSQWVADFETTTNLDDCRVWAWATSLIEDPEQTQYGTTIQEFMELVKSQPGEYWFHNLKFDGEFIFYWLLTNGFKHTTGKAESKTFKTLISATGNFYQIQVFFEVKNKRKAHSVTFKDSLKKLPMTVDQIAKSFNLPINKLSIDYNEDRPIGHELTSDEIAYILNDVKIVAYALKTQFAQGLEALTIGADALKSYKGLQQYFKTYYPVLSLPMDMEIRKSYKGGWTYANPKYQADENHPNRTVKKGLVFDVNSLYPSVMYGRWLPVGEPVFFHGEYKTDSTYPLYIQYLTCHVKLKKNHLPTLQIKNSPYFAPTRYIEDSETYVDLALTSVDLALLLEHYDVTIHSYNGGFKFKQARGIFCQYIDEWMEIKQSSTGGIRQLAKLMLNSLYGKFATNPDVTGKEPYLKDDGSVGYRLLPEEVRKPVFTAMGSFITAYARDVTIRAAQKNYDRFLYADTDSLHLLGTELPDLDIHPTRLGAWSEEAQFSKAKYLRAKTYIEQITHIGTADENGEMYMQPIEPYNDVKCAGMPDNVKKNITFANFKRGNSWMGKLKPKHVPGGIVLVDTPFTLL